MKSRIFLYIMTSAVICSVLLCGCGRSFDRSGCITAMLDTACKGDYTSYSEYTGYSTADLASQRDEWLDSEAGRFIALFNVPQPSDSTRASIEKFLSLVYANAQYSVAGVSSEPAVSDTADSLSYSQSGGEEAAADENSVTVTVKPITLLTGSISDIREYTDSFNKKNSEFAYSAVSSQEYADSYFSGLLTLLQGKLADISFGQPVRVTVSFSKGKGGLYTISSDDLRKLTDAILPFPG